jgi:hypothetical protein
VQATVAKLGTIAGEHAGMTHDQQAILDAINSVTLRAEALARGYDDRTIARMVRTGVWHKVRHGAYIGADVWSGLDSSDRHRSLLRAVLRTAKSPCVASHLSAAVELGAPTWDLDLSVAHLTRLDGRSGRKEAGVPQHRGLVQPHEIQSVNGVAVTSGTRIALDVIRTAPDPEHALVVVNGLLHDGHTTLDDLRAAHELTAHWPDTRPAHVVLSLADPRPESVGESRSVFMCWAQGIPKPEPQYEIFDERGQLVARVDLAWPGRRTYLEFDGLIKYTRLLKKGESATDVVLREKRREELIFRLTGWRCIRITWADLDRPAATARAIAALFAIASAA